MFLFDIPVAGIARQGSKTVQLRLSQAEWPFADNMTPVFFFTNKGGAQQGTYITSVQNLGMQDNQTNSGEWHVGDAQANFTLSRRKLRRETNHPDWFSLAPMWTKLTITNPLIRDVEEDSQLVIYQNGKRFEYLVGAYKAGETEVLVKDDLIEFDAPFTALLDYEQINVNWVDIVGFSLITLSLSDPITEELLSTDKCAVYFNDLASSGWSTMFHKWADTWSGVYNSGEAYSYITSLTGRGDYGLTSGHTYGTGLTLTDDHVSGRALSYQAPYDPDANVDIFPYLTVRHNGLIYTRQQVDISQGGNDSFDGLGSFRTHIIESVGLLSILYNRYKMDTDLVDYLYDSLIKMIKTIPQFFSVDDFSKIGDLQYPAPYTYSVDCYSFPARQEDLKYEVIQVQCANGEIIIPDPTTSRIIQITKSDPGTTDLHLRKPDAVDIKAAFLPGGQTVYGDTASPYSTNIYRGVILSDPLDAETLYLVRTVSGKEAEGEISFPITFADKYDVNGALSLKSIQWNNDGGSYTKCPDFTPYWTFPYLSAKGPNNFEGIRPDDAALALFFGLYLQEADDDTLKSYGQNIIDLCLPWMSETWKLTRLTEPTNHDFGLYSTTRFTTFELPDNVNNQLLTLQTVNGPYYAYANKGQKVYTMDDFVASSILNPAHLVNAYSSVGSSIELTGKNYPATLLTFKTEGYTTFTYGLNTPPIITFESKGYCRVILTDVEGWRYAMQCDNQKLINWSTSKLKPDPFQKNYTACPALGTYTIATLEIHGNNSTATLVWMSNIDMEESTFQGGEIYELDAKQQFTYSINSLVDVGEPYQGAFPHFIGKTGFNPYIPTTDTPFRGPISVVQQAPIIYALENDIGSATAVVTLVKQAQEYYQANMRQLTELWDGQVDDRPDPFLTGVAPTYTYSQDDAIWAQSSDPGFSWLSPVEDWSDARTTFKMYFNLALYWRQSQLQATDYPNTIVEVFQRMVGGLQYLYNVIYAMGTEEALTKSNIAVSGDWPSYMRAIQAGDNRLFWCGFGQQGPCVGHNLGAVCYAIAASILVYQAGMKDQKVFDYIIRMINTLYSYSGSAWWTRNTQLTDPDLTLNWTDGAFVNAPSLEDFYVLNGEDYGILMFVLGLIDQYFTDIDTQDTVYAVFPVKYTDEFTQYTQIQDANPNVEDETGSKNESSDAEQTAVPPSKGAPMPKDDSHTIAFVADPKEDIPNDPGHDTNSSLQQ